MRNDGVPFSKLNDTPPHSARWTPSWVVEWWRRRGNGRPFIIIILNLLPIPNYGSVAIVMVGAFTKFHCFCSISSVLLLLITCFVFSEKVKKSGRSTTNLLDHTRRMHMSIYSNAMTTQVHGWFWWFDLNPLSQESVNDKIVRLVANNSLAFRIVETTEFVDLVKVRLVFSHKLPVFIKFSPWILQ